MRLIAIALVLLSLAACSNNRIVLRKVGEKQKVVNVSSEERKEVKSQKLAKIESHEEVEREIISIEEAEPSIVESLDSDETNNIVVYNQTSREAAPQDTIIQNVTDREYAVSQAFASERKAITSIVLASAFWLVLAILITLDILIWIDEILYLIPLVIILIAWPFAILAKTSRYTTPRGKRLSTVGLILTIVPTALLLILLGLAFI